MTYDTMDDNEKMAIKYSNVDKTTVPRKMKPKKHKVKRNTEIEYLRKLIEEVADCRECEESYKLCPDHMPIAKSLGCFKEE